MIFETKFIEFLQINVRCCIFYLKGCEIIFVHLLDIMISNDGLFNQFILLILFNQYLICQLF